MNCQLCYVVAHYVFTTLTQLHSSFHAALLQLTSWGVHSAQFNEHSHVSFGNAQ